ncbi:hypothetical protein CBR_g4531 [Chara braunii]|uniref:Integrase catalytic domain-containing protein n=1 Tax=Chara braunii TaxID=69332 RepID=A0A388KI29_CHABU|nr:hypothetical protein CBR_g4531 [Chara braunii]|eukprot:GBG69699.1 hypothetical protein CBR_g4531 [Chara braunii]
MPLSIPERPSESLSMDFMDTLITSKSGMRHIFVIVDKFGKYVRLVAMSEAARTEYVIRMFKENWVRDFGLPKSIISDRDVRFTSELWKAAAAEQGTQLQMTSGNHPEANGQAEQLNRIVQHLLRHYIKPNQVDWDEKLALIANLYNNAVHSATGVSPNSLLLTFMPRLPLDFLLPENQSTAAPEQTKVATILGLPEGPALKWVTSTSSSQQQSMEDWAFGLGVDRLLQALEDRFANKERARKAADKITRLGQQRYSGTLRSLFAEFEQLTSTPGLVMSTDDLLTNFCRAAPEKFVVALYSAGHKDWRSFGRAALDMEAKLHVQAPSSDRRKGAFPRGGRKGKAAFAHADSASASYSDSQADTPSAGTGSAAETDVAAALTQAVLGVLQQQKRFSSTTASASAKGKTRDVVDQYADLMQEPFGLPNRPTKHRMELLPGPVPPKGRIYRMSPAELEEFRKQLETLTIKGSIRPSTSEFGAPVLFVPKGNGEFKMCIDYRGLNKITRKSTEPLPRLDDLLDMVQGCTVFTKVDLKSGYHQIEMADEDVYKTASKTRYSTYEFLVIPFGLYNVPGTFHTEMHRIFRPSLDKFMVVYLDDILVFSRIAKEHEEHLTLVLQSLHDSQYKINREKSSFGVPSAIIWVM